MRWPKLWQQVEKKQLLYLDYHFAEKICPEGTETEAAFVAALMANARAGHICMKESEGAKSYPPFIEQCGEYFYLQKNYFYETTVLNEVKRLLSYPITQAAKFTLTATDEQKEAVKKSLEHPLSLITGGPGTGKSYTALQIITVYKDAKIIVCAPTGKAVRLLESKCTSKVTYGTLHTILGIRSASDYAEISEPLDADLVIVDECSMIDAALFARLLTSIGPKTRLVLMGDSDQLPAVESGSFFADLVQVARKLCSIPYTHLSLCLRCDQTEILSLVDAIRKGNENFNYETASVTKEQLWSYVTENFPLPSPCKPEQNELIEKMSNFRILSSMRQGLSGVDTLNRAISARLLKTKQPSDYCALPIIITRNDQQTGLVNGETGFLIKTPSQEEDYALFDDGRVFPAYLLPSFEYAYCLSVHKSQGSEYDHVLLIIPDGSEHFGKELLYTAATRARKSLKLHASREMIRATLSQSSRKLSRLVARFKNKN